MKTNGDAIRNSRRIPSVAIYLIIGSVLTLFLYILSMVPVSIMYTNGTLHAYTWHENICTTIYEPLNYAVSQSDTLHGWAHSYAKTVCRAFSTDLAFADITWWHIRWDHRKMDEETERLIQQVREETRRDIEEHKKRKAAADAAKGK